MTFEIDSDILSLDRDASLSLNIHRVQVLRLHQPWIHRSSDLKDPVRQRRLSVVDVANNGKIPD